MKDEDVEIEVDSFERRLTTGTGDNQGNDSKREFSEQLEDEECWGSKR